jgi:hypothetical protein
MEDDECCWYVDIGVEFKGRHLFARISDLQAELNSQDTFIQVQIITTQPRHEVAYAVNLQRKVLYHTFFLHRD